MTILGLGSPEVSAILAGAAWPELRRWRDAGAARAAAPPIGWRAALSWLLLARPGASKADPKEGLLGLQRSSTSFLISLNLVGKASYG